jgi:hypothetical protein
MYQNKIKIHRLQWLRVSAVVRSLRFESCRETWISVCLLWELLCRQVKRSLRAADHSSYWVWRV